jgi:3-dehydrosphinganine reductase
MDRLAEGAVALGAILVGLLFYVGIVWKPKVRIGNLRNKHLIITGGSSGIGLQIAREALLQEAFVTVIARNRDLTEQVNCERSRINTKVVINLWYPFSL